jgi:hypothetical protein
MKVKKGWVDCLDCIIPKLGRSKKDLRWLASCSMNGCHEKEEEELEEY